MNKTFLFILLAVCSTAISWAETPSYNYITAKELRRQITEATPPVLLDIQFPKAYNYQHLKGALATYSYPLKTDASKAKLKAVAPQLKETTGPIVIISTRGGGGAMIAFDLLKAEGIAPERLAILRYGQQRWPYPELTENIAE